MKKCTYCGKQYFDDATVCPIDAQPLVRIAILEPSLLPPVIKPNAPRPARLILGTIGFMGTGLLIVICCAYNLRVNRILYLTLLLTGVGLFFVAGRGLTDVLEAMAIRRRPRPQNSANKCSYCGREKESAAVACPGCGTKFGAE